MQAMEWTPERLERFWRYQAAREDEYFTKKFGAQICRRIAPFLAGSRSILDFGCGPGHLVRHLAALGRAVTATDASAAAIEAANRNNRGVRGFEGAFPVGDLRQTGARFDALVSVEAVEHMDDAALAAFFADARALVKPGGTLVITTPNEEDLSLSEVYCPSCDAAHHRWQHVRSWSAAGLAAAVERAGFAVTRTVATDFAAPRIPSWRTVAKRLVGRTGKPPHLFVVARRP